LKLKPYMPMAVVGLFLLFAGIFWLRFWPSIVAGAALIAGAAWEFGYERRKDGRTGSGLSSR
jgi:hypothetical protein